MYAGFDIVRAVLYAYYDRKHLENYKIRLENSWIFFIPKEWEPCLYYHYHHLLIVITANNFY